MCETNNFAFYLPVYYPLISCYLYKLGAIFTLVNPCVKPCTVAGCPMLLLQLCIKVVGLILVCLINTDYITAGCHNICDTINWMLIGESQTWYGYKHLLEYKLVCNLSQVVVSQYSLKFAMCLYDVFMFVWVCGFFVLQDSTIHYIIQTDRMTPVMPRWVTPSLNK